jgi:signal transduction histidine kinase
MTETPLSVQTLIQLLRQMGHDIRAPLGSIISTSDMLLEGTYDPLTDKQMRATKRLSRSSRRTLAMIDDFITYVKAEVADLPLVPRPFDPHVNLRAWLDQVKPSAEEKGIACELAITEQVPALIVGDAALINRIVTALLWNGVAFTTEGSLRVESDWSDGAGWTIRFCDTGSGISSEDAPHIFEPFFRGQERPQVPTAGAGLGLALSLALVKLMQGQLVLENTGAGGSTFCLSLPIAPAD